MHPSATFWHWVALAPFVFAQIDQTSTQVSSSPAAQSSVLSVSSTVSVSESAIPLPSVSATSSASTVGQPPRSTFTPFPPPLDNPVPSIYPEADPLNPTEVGSRAIPNFGPAWASAWSKAEAKIANFTLEEKVSVTTGVGWQNDRCVGNIPRIEPQDGRGWPGLCLEDSPLGVRFADFVTAFPTGVNTAASFSRRFMRLRGLYMGHEFVGKGVNVALGPTMNMGRVAQGGRNWEGFGGDPFLAGEASYETILGLQEAGVIACAKHLVGNEQEIKRRLSSSEIDDRTVHEVYAHPFLKSVMAGVGSMMCSYNQVNGTYACDNDKMMNDIVKREFGFRGFIMSDWNAQMWTTSATTGLDMAMPGDIGLNHDPNISYFGGNLTAYVNDGTIAEALVDDMATRIIASWYLLHQDRPSFPAVNFNAFDLEDDATNLHVDVEEDHHKLVRELGAASTVLLKNEKGVLPLGRKDRSIVLVGSGADRGRAGPNVFRDHAGLDGALGMGWGSGTARYPYLVPPIDAIQREARKFRTSVSYAFDDFDLETAGRMSRKQSAALVFVMANSGEQYLTVDGNVGDRNNLTAWRGGDELIAAVAAQNNNTIVIVNSVGPIIMESWIDHPNVTAVLWAGVPGQEIGNSIADVLYGAWNPSGRLPYTIAKRAEDYGAQIVTGGGPQDIISIPYTEGLEIDYRHFDARNITPRFEFGFGLSYTEFSYSGLQLSKIESAVSSPDPPLVEAWERGDATPISVGSSRAIWLHTPAYEAIFTVRNTGRIPGAEIPQLYLNFPASAGEPPLVLRGFADVFLGPGKSRTLTITLSRYDLSIWDVEKQGWRKPSGQFGVVIGASSRDARLRGTVPV
ncbi:unnamed protein product [Cyclocybe aegerita]|uniref:beta-glucosidase n=1 Tax=Cyclocybe aegerita TaxID=1973307 RepID=A0A8S0WBL4_CYCAE|nr:unnamed protein product [Cyclocybe aegerita]